MTTLAKLEKEIEDTRKRLSDLEITKATLLSLDGGSRTHQPSFVETLKHAPTQSSKAPAKKKAKPVRASKPQPNGKAAQSGAAAFKSFSFAGKDTEPTIKEKIVKTLEGTQSPMSSAELIDANSDRDRKASYWSTLTTMVQNNDVVRTPDKKYVLPEKKSAADQPPA